MTDIQDISKIASHRALSQAKLDNRNKQANSQFREQPQEKPRVQKADLFSQYAKSTSKILSDDTSEDDLPR